MFGRILAGQNVGPSGELLPAWMYVRPEQTQVINRDIRLREVLLLTAAAYTVWTPLYFLAKPETVTPPTGGRVELILPVGHFDEDGKVSRRFGFRQRGTEAEAGPVLYEGSKPLPPSLYDLAPFNPKNKWREVTFSSSDGSDPRYNGRRYYAVTP
jgi:hypothetical protein